MLGLSGCQVMDELSAARYLNTSAGAIRPRSPLLDVLTKTFSEYLPEFGPYIYFSFVFIIIRKYIVSVDYMRRGSVVTVKYMAVGTPCFGEHYLRVHHTSKYILPQL